MGVIIPMRETLGNSGTSNPFNQNSKPNKKKINIYYEILIYESERDEEKANKKKGLHQKLQ